MRRFSTAIIGLAAVVGLAACNPAPGGVGTPSAPVDGGSATTGKVVEVPASIDRTGRTDVTNALNDVLARLAPGTTLRFPAGARYRVEGSLVLPQRERVTIEGNGATLFATTVGPARPNAHAPSVLKPHWPRKRVHLFVNGGSDITIRGLTIVGANPRAGMADEAYVEDLEAQHGIELVGVRRALVDRVRVSDTYGDLIAVTGGSDSVTIRGSLLERSGRQGITVNHGYNVLIESNAMKDIRRSAFDLEPPGTKTEVRNVRIRNNLIGEIRLTFVASLGRGPVNDVYVEGNVLVDQPINVTVRAPEGTRRRNFQITGNRSDDPVGSPVALMRFQRVDDIVVRGNVQPFDSRRVGIALEVLDSCRFQIAGNDFPGITSLVTTGSRRC